MIKKSLKSFNFIETNIPSILDGLEMADTPIGGYVLGIDPAGGVNWIQPNIQPNNWTVRLDMENNPDPQLVLDANGDARFSGRVHALGSVIWNQELNRLEFWDGENWQPIHI